MKPIILIPARMASTRLPGKPLALIAGRPMILHVLAIAQAAALGPVAVACAEPEIAEIVTAAGGHAILTDPALPSGSDRIHAALQHIDPAGHHDTIINLQGDIPTLPPAHLTADVRRTRKRMRPRIRRQERNAFGHAPLRLHLEGVVDRIADRLVARHRALEELIRAA